MNYLWAFMILSGVIFSAFHGTIPAVTGAVLDSAKEAVTLCITMTGVMSFWPRSGCRFPDCEGGLF